MVVVLFFFVDLVSLINLFGGGFVFFYALGRFTLCIWERDSIMNLNSFKTPTMRFYLIYLEGFSSNFF